MTSSERYESASHRNGWLPVFLILVGIIGGAYIMNEMRLVMFMLPPSAVAFVLLISETVRCERNGS